MNIDDSLMCLPVRLAACKKVLMLIGQSYLTRLWCIMEIVVLIAAVNDMTQFLAHFALQIQMKRPKLVSTTLHRSQQEGFSRKIGRCSGLRRSDLDLKGSTLFNCMAAAVVLDFVHLSLSPARHIC